MNQKTITAFIVTASLVVAFLLAQPDVVFGPGMKVILGALNVALTYWARQSQPNEPANG